MECKRCGCTDCPVLATETTPLTAISRHRRCTNCGLQFTTCEVYKTALSTSHVKRSTEIVTNRIARFRREISTAMDFMSRNVPIADYARIIGQSYGNAWRWVENGRTHMLLLDEAKNFDCKQDSGK